MSSSPRKALAAKCEGPIPTAHTDVRQESSHLRWHFAHKNEKRKKGRKKKRREERKIEKKEEKREERKIEGRKKEERERTREASPGPLALPLGALRGSRTCGHPARFSLFRGVGELGSS